MQRVWTILTITACMAGGVAGPHTAPPDYSTAQQLSDAAALAELIVAGWVTTDDDEALLVVDDVLFGAPLPELRNRDGALQLVGPRRAETDRPGIFLLVRHGNGYVIVNPTPVTPAAYAQIERPVPHWSAAPDLVANVTETGQCYHTFKPEDGVGGRWHGTNVHGGADGVTVELRQDNERVFRVSWNRQGVVTSLSRYPRLGDGFFIRYDDHGGVRAFERYRDRRHHGTSMQLFRDGAPRSEIVYQHGARHGRCRWWHAHGEVDREIVYRHGLAEPVVRYGGEGSPRARTHLRRGVVVYDDIGGTVSQVRVGMTAREVSEVLCVDYSLRDGLHYPAFRADQYLHIGFEDGRVNTVRQGHNGVCLGVPE